MVFVDITTGTRFLGNSTRSTGKTEVIDGVRHQVISLSVSSDSHPFYTGRTAFVDTEGRIDKFNKRYGSAGRRPTGKKRSAVALSA